MVSHFSVSLLGSVATVGSLYSAGQDSIFFGSAVTRWVFAVAGQGSKVLGSVASLGSFVGQGSKVLCSVATHGSFAVQGSMVLGSVATIGSFIGQGSMVLGSVLLPLGLCRTGFDSFHGGLEHFPHTVVKHAGRTTTPIEVIRLKVNFLFCKN